MEFLKEVYDVLKVGYHFVNRYTNAAFLCFALGLGTIMLLATCTADAAAAPETSPGGVPKFDIVVNPSGDDVVFMQGPTPGTLVFCEGAPGADGLHVCQVWLMLSKEMGVPAGGEAYCFVAGEEEVIHNGVSQTRKNWSCSHNREGLSEQRKARGPVNLQMLPRTGEVSI